ncbi:sialate:O-sulfotransferase 1-like [Physella acuta]|uniref:sialate:O-sulfotransferase 1-like n=1 Tax=Physella acuta TaxID=109671 RepID=UPI0027DAC802|nr:sialate:O-sulfotransferase 1-like [Physella acuta]
MQFIKIALVVVFMLTYSKSDATSININEVKAVGCLKVAEGSESFKTLAKDYGALQLEVKMCVFRCWKLRFFYAGMQKGNLCFCGMSIKDTARVPIETCDRRCPGNCYQACGGDTALSVYKTGYVREPVIAMERFSLLKANIGCYARKDSMLILCPKDFAPLRTERMSVPLCIYYCDAMYQTKFSTTTGDDRCCCSNSVTGAKNTMLSWCNIPCAGDVTPTLYPHPVPPPLYPHPPCTPP